MQTDTTHYLIVGAGVTGWSVANFLHARQKNFRIMDTRDMPPYAAPLNKMMPSRSVCFGRFDQQWINESDVVILSPGVSLQTPEIQNAITSDVEVIGDVELFVRHANKPYIAITGSNGKSTVTTLVTDILNSQGLVAKAGANIGTPALSLLDESNVDIYVLELSSFQLETSSSIRPAAAVVLNVSADHLDRHQNLEQYARIKNSIYNFAQRKVCLRSEDALRIPEAISFGLDEPEDGDYGIKQDSSGRWLVCGENKIVAVKDLLLLGATGELNVMAALALSKAYINNEAAALNAIRNFKGLPHRCELVLEQGEVRWVNDSKGTNVGATVAAIKSFAQSQVLILGGIHKGGAIDSLVGAVQQNVRLAIVFGRDQKIFTNALQDVTKVITVDSLDDAVQQAAENVVEGEVVLFSPACSSFDMFANYEERGHMFQQAVMQLVQGDDDVC